MHTAPSIQKNLQNIYFFNVEKILLLTNRHGILSEEGTAEPEGKDVQVRSQAWEKLLKPSVVCAEISKSSSD